MRKAESEPPEESLRRLKGLWHARGIPASAVQPLQKLGEGAFAVVELCSITGLVVDQAGKVVPHPSTHGQGQPGPTLSVPQQHQTPGEPQLSAAAASKQQVTLCPSGVNGLASTQPGPGTALPGAPLLAAVKRLKPAAESDPHIRHMFLNEAQLLLRLQHPAIVNAIGIGFEGDNPGEGDATHPPGALFLVQEHLKGVHLRRLITRSMIKTNTSGQSVYSRRDAVRWGAQLARGLAYLHSRAPPVMHRDVKLENVLLTSEDPGSCDIKLIDFGLAIKLPGAMIQEAPAQAVPQRSAVAEAGWTRSLSRLESLHSKSPSLHSTTLTATATHNTTTGLYSNAANGTVTSTATSRGPTVHVTLPHTRTTSHHLNGSKHPPGSHLAPLLNNGNTSRNRRCLSGGAVSSEGSTGGVQTAVAGSTAAPAARTTPNNTSSNPNPTASAPVDIPGTPAQPLQEPLPSPSPPSKPTSLPQQLSALLRKLTADDSSLHGPGQPSRGSQDGGAGADDQAAGMADQRSYKGSLFKALRLKGGQMSGSAATPAAAAEGKSVHVGSVAGADRGLGGISEEQGDSGSLQELHTPKEAALDPISDTAGPAFRPGATNGTSRLGRAASHQPFPEPDGGDTSCAAPLHPSSPSGSTHHSRTSGTGQLPGGGLSGSGKVAQLLGKGRIAMRRSRQVPSNSWGSSTGGGDEDRRGSIDGTSLKEGTSDTCTTVSMGPAYIATWVAPLLQQEERTSAMNRHSAAGSVAGAQGTESGAAGPAVPDSHALPTHTPQPAGIPAGDSSTTSRAILQQLYQRHAAAGKPPLAHNTQPQTMPDHKTTTSSLGKGYASPELSPAWQTGMTAAGVAIRGMGQGIPISSGPLPQVPHSPLVGGSARPAAAAGSLCSTVSGASDLVILEAAVSWGEPNAAAMLPSGIDRVSRAGSLANQNSWVPPQSNGDQKLATVPSPPLSPLLSPTLLKAAAEAAAHVKQERQNHQRCVGPAVSATQAGQQSAFSGQANAAIPSLPLPPLPPYLVHQLADQQQHQQQGYQQQGGNNHQQPLASISDAQVSLPRSTAHSSSQQQCPGPGSVYHHEATSAGGGGGDGTGRSSHRRGGLYSLLQPIKSLRLEDIQAVSMRLHTLTSRTGSLLYMAPEVFKGEPYNCKADVFSFGVCLYELLHVRVVLNSVLQTAGEDDKQQAIIKYASAVAAGYRPPISPSLPASLKELLQQCWSTNPLERPNMDVVAARLEAVLEEEVALLDALDASAAAAGASACCAGRCTVS